MFERYTEHARRALFFARHSASQFGSPTIETEHLLLGLLREAGPLISRLAPGISIDDIRQKIRDHIVIREKVPAAIQMPLSAECKRILSYAEDEADRMGDRHIGAEHLLLGVLRENTCLAARLLNEAHVHLNSVQGSLSKSNPGDPHPETSLGREGIHELVDQLPEALIGQIQWMIDGMRAATQRTGPLSERHSGRDNEAPEAT